MRFIGQNHIMNQLRFILPELYKNPENGANILLRGPSGYGKTTMALGICSYLAGKDFIISSAEFPSAYNKRVIFIDEVHKIEGLESLYHLMDLRSRVLVFATNSDGNLPEAFQNRCWEFIFKEYDDDELLIIAKDSAEFYAPIDKFVPIVEAGARNPRIIKSLVSRLNMYFSQNKDVDPSTVDFTEIMEQVFDIQDGLDTLCRRYLEALENVGGVASINLLKSILHVDQNTLTNQVEPILMKKGLVQISSKGRKLI